jgi:hypothetical protein
LVQQDLPLFLQLPGEQLARLAGSGKRRSLPGQATSSGDAPVWLQLRRLLVGTPEVAVRLGAGPKLQVEVPSSMLAAAGTAVPLGTAPTPTAAGTVTLEYQLAAPLALPSASFCVLALPWLLTAPMQLPQGDLSTAGNAAPTALIRQSGPLRAVLLGNSAVWPQGMRADVRP